MGSAKVMLAAAVLALVVVATVPRAAAASLGGIDGCWAHYLATLRALDEQYRNPGGSGSSGGSNIGEWHDGWIQAGDELVECVTRALDGTVVASVRFAHLPGSGMAHGAVFAFDNPDARPAARVLLFTAPLGDSGAGVVPAVHVNGRAAWSGDEPPAEGPLGVEMPLLPGRNQVLVRCDPDEPAAVLLVFEALD